MKTDLEEILEVFLSGLFLFQINYKLPSYGSGMDNHRLDTAEPE